MALDPATILVTQILIILLVSVSCFVTWLGAREEDALLWMSGAALLTALGLTARFCLPPPASIILSNGLIEDGGCGLWLACRRLRRASAPAGTLALPPLLWCLLPLLPALFGDIGRRVVIAYLVLGLFFLLAAAEVWKLERDSGPLRLYIFSLLGFQTAIDFVWAAYNVALPPGEHAALVTLPGVAITDLLSLFTTLLITIGFIVLVRERMVRAYRNAAMLDAVTGIANRRAFDERLSALLAQAARRGTSLALVMMDADHFKSYNDRYGHVLGDACLRSLALSLQATAAESGGSVFRYGGEEFAALVPELDHAAVMALAERLRLGVRSLRILHESEAQGIVTVSMGVALAEAGPRGGKPEMALALIRAADDALYQAKQSGRDRIIIMGEGQAPAARPGSASPLLSG